MTIRRYLAGLLCATALCCSPARAQIFNPTDSAGIITACGSSDTQVLFTSGTSCAGSANFTWSSPALTLGVATSTTGQLKLTGGTSGTITITGQAAAGTFEFDLPITAGSAAQVLTSQGGAGAAMTWTTLAASATTDTTNATNISSGTLPAGRLPNPSATTLGGIESYAAVSNQWINTISTSGVPSSTQPACGNLSNAAASCSTDATNASNIGSGTLPAARLPNPSATTLGGIESLAAVSHKWINTISTSGVPAATQPACADVSDAAASCATDATNASNIGSGSLAAARETAAGSNTQVQFNSSNAFAGSANLTWVSPALTIGVATSTTGVLKLTGATSGTITITGQAAAGTYEFDLPTTAGSSGNFLTSAGGAGAAMTWTAAPVSATAANIGAACGTDTQVVYVDSTSCAGNAGLTFSKTPKALTITSAANPSSSSLILTGATALTTSQPVLNMTQTWVTAGTTYTGIKLNVTNTASAAASLLLDLEVGGGTVFAIREDGALLLLGGTSSSFPALRASGNNIEIIDAAVTQYTSLSALGYLSIGGTFAWVNNAVMQSPADGIIEITNNAQSSFTRLQFGGTTSSFPSLKRSTTSLIARLADDSADSGFEARSFTSGGATPTVTGTCTAPTMAGGNTAGTMTTGTGCAGTTIILTFALTAPTGWACTTTNRTLSTRVMPQTATSTTTATFTGTTNNSDVLQYSCLAY